MYIPVKTPCARELRLSAPLPVLPGSPRLLTWRDIPQRIRLRARVARVARRAYAKARVWLGLDWPLGVELAAEALHYKFTQAAADDAPRGAKGGAA